jgi:exosortase F-associated protein
MQLTHLKSAKNRFGLVLLILALAAIRGIEELLFYDPFLQYFKNDYLQVAWPEFETWKLNRNLMIRFWMNSVFSIGIIHLIFQDSLTTKFASILYVLFFLVLFVAFQLLIYYGSENQNFWLFYLRRFLIHPVLLLLFLPAFYFQRLQNRIN